MAGDLRGLALLSKIPGLALVAWMMEPPRRGVQIVLIIEVNLRFVAAFLRSLRLEIFRYTSKRPQSSYKVF